MAASKAQRWTREQLLIAFNLYCRLPFGRLHAKNPLVMRTAEMIGKSSGALAMKMVNFASLDPQHQARGVKGLSNASAADREMWQEFEGNWEGLAFESEMARRSLTGAHEEIEETALRPPVVGAETEKFAITRMRIMQGFFRSAVLAAYEYRCACCQLALVPMLNASHIIPWSVSEVRRGDPTNGLSLCAFHDRAFDRGFMSVDREWKIMVAPEAKAGVASGLHRIGLVDAEGAPLHLPHRFVPDQSALAYHREHVFQA